MKLPAAVDLSEVPLRELLAEVSRRAIPLCPSGQLTCACGETFASPDQLDLHFYDVFLPADDIGTDGRLHTEIWAGQLPRIPLRT